MDRIVICVLLLGYLYNGVAGECSTNEDVYLGKCIGELNSYHHQVGGDVYAVNDYTFHIKNFMYDGNGKDTFFWAGSLPRPGPQGFLVPNEIGRTNVLGTYSGDDITIRLPDRKSIRDIRWLSVYDLTRHEVYGDIYIPQDFEPPHRVQLNSLTGKSGHVDSSPVVIVDSKTLRIDKFEYDGSGTEVYFWVGVGPQPHSKGDKIPDELGYLTPLGRYLRADIVLTLPGDLSVQTINWLAVYDVVEKRVLGSVIIHSDLNVPPSLVRITPHTNSMPQCEQLHRDMQISWSVFGGSATIEIAAKMELTDYAAFGISGDPEVPQMVGGDAVYLHRDEFLGHINDLNLTSYFPCTHLLEQKKGACFDDDVGGTQDYQLMSSERKDGVTVFIFRRRLATADAGDSVYLEKGPMMIIWALGKMDEQQRPAFHRAWSKVAQTLDFGRAPSKNCYSFTHEPDSKMKSWATEKLTDTNAESFTARLGPDGGPRGYVSITGNLPITGKAWYINGLLAPELYLRRNKPYKILVEGGAFPHNPANYHPFIITDEPHGGFSQMSAEEKSNVRILAGISSTRRGDIRPMRAGRLCEWKHPNNVDRRRDADIQTFPEYRNSLQLHCDEDGGPATLEIFPNKSWPSTVYYNSWTGRNMGWKIHILDEKEDPNIIVSAASRESVSFSLLSVVIVNYFILSLRRR